MSTREEFLVQRYHNEIWVRVDYFPDIESAKSYVKRLKGKFRLLKRTVTDWEEVKDED